MKRNYDTVLIVDGALLEDQINSTISGIEEYLKKSAEIKQVERRGKRKMAYAINKKTHGDYTVISYSAEGNLIAELEKKLTLNENVIRFLTVVRE